MAKPNQKKPGGPGPKRSGAPRATPQDRSEQARESIERQQARDAQSSNRDRMIDIGRGSQQSGRH